MSPADTHEYEESRRESLIFMRRHAIALLKHSEKQLGMESSLVPKKVDRKQTGDK